MHSAGSAAIIAFVIVNICAGGAMAEPTTGMEARASSVQAGFPARGACNGERFAARAEAAWKGEKGTVGWWWEVRFDRTTEVGAIVQIHGDDPHIFHNAPRRYVWRASVDGTTWQDLKETQTQRERRLFRVHRLEKAVRVRAMRLEIPEAAGEYPVLREVEFHPEPSSPIRFDDWVIVVSTTDVPTLPGAGRGFIDLLRECHGWEKTAVQEVWLDSFDESFVAVEPRPLCAFLSGNFKDWCQVDRAPWRGVQEVLAKRNLPIWGACGGAQGLAILAEAGVDKEWDCPHCRDPKNPKTPIYTHICCTASRPCGDYSACVFERGPHNVLQVVRDPVFANVPREFRTMESHCGQIEWPPAGWILVATKGQGGKTKTQCLRVKDRYIYAAQFHIEMKGTPETSRTIMGNFLSLAKSWGGYNPEGKAVAIPQAWADGER